MFVTAAAAPRMRLCVHPTSPSSEYSNVESRWNSNVTMPAFGRYFQTEMSSCSNLSSIYTLMIQQSNPVTLYSASQRMAAHIIYASFGRRRVHVIQLNLLFLQHIKKQPYVMDMNLLQRIHGYRIGRLHQPPKLEMNRLEMNGIRYGTCTMEMRYVLDVA